MKKKKKLIKRIWNPKIKISFTKEELFQLLVVVKAFEIIHFPSNLVKEDTRNLYSKLREKYL